MPRVAAERTHSAGKAEESARPRFCLAPVLCKVEGMALKGCVSASSTGWFPIDLPRIPSCFAWIFCLPGTGATAAWLERISAHSCHGKACCGFPSPSWLWEWDRGRWWPARGSTAKPAKPALKTGTAWPNQVCARGLSNQINSCKLLWTNSLPIAWKRASLPHVVNSNQMLQVF